MCEYPELRISRGRADKRSDAGTGTEKPGRVRPLQARSLAGRGGDAAAPRRARAADRRHPAPQPSWSNPLGVSSPPAGQPDLDPLALADLADLRQRRFRRLRRSVAAASASRPGGQRRQQLVVLAAGGGQLERVAAGGGGDLGQPRLPAAVPPASIRRPTPLAAARWAASPPRPSLRSIIARGARRGQGAAGARGGASVRAGAAAGAAAVCVGYRLASSGRSSSSRPAAAPPSSPVRTRASPGRAPPRATSRSARRRVADDGDGEGQRRRPGDVAAGQGRAGLRRPAPAIPSISSRQPSSSRSGGTPTTT